MPERTAVERLLDALETCHICEGQLSLDDVEPTHCENCSSDCEEHDGAACSSLYVLHSDARREARAATRRAEEAEAKLAEYRKYLDDVAGAFAIPGSEGTYRPDKLGEQVRELTAHAGELREALAKLLYKFNGQWYVVTTPEHIIDSAAKALALTPPEALKQVRQQIAFDSGLDAVEQRERIRREVALECIKIASEVADSYEFLSLHAVGAETVAVTIRKRFGLDQPAQQEERRG